MKTAKYGVQLSTDAMDMPKVSVVILTYQNFKGLWRTLETVDRQNYSNLEVLISDDGSSCFPRKELDQWKQEHPGLEVKLRQGVVNFGTVRHANLAATFCSGEYIKFLPPGDGFRSEKALEALVKQAQITCARITTSPSLVYVNNYQNVKYAFPSQHRTRILKRLTAEELFPVLARANIISAVGTLFHRDFFEAGGFDESFRYLDDWPTWLSVLRRGERIEVLEMPTVYYGLDGMSNRDGTAFSSALLREDLIHCYEQEILPYQSRLSPLTRWFIGYRYGELTGRKSGIGEVRYFPIRIYCHIKKAIKHILTSM